MEKKSESSTALFAEFERYLLTEKRASKNTFDSYRSDLRQLKAFLEKNNLDLANVVTEHLKQFIYYLKDQAVSARSIARKISSVKALFKYLHDFHGYANTAHELILPKLEKKLPHYLTEQQLDSLFTYAQQQHGPSSERNWVMLLVLYASGLRISELVELKRQDFDASQGFLTVKGKGGKERFVPLPLPVVTTLQHYCSITYKKLITKNKKQYPTHYLFPVFYKDSLRSMSRQLFWLYLKKIAEAAGVPTTLSPHQLRHSLATHLLEKGANLRSLQLLLGHEQLTTVQIYTHIETSHLRNVYDRFHPRA